MRMTMTFAGSSRWIAAVFAAMVLFGIPYRTRAGSVQFDLSNGVNWDGYCSSAEVTEALSYNPPGDWNDPTALTARTVAAIFGQHSFAGFAGRTFAWQNQVGASVGLPDSGVLTAGSWTYQLATNLDAAPVGGWGNPQYAKPTNPAGLLPSTNNVIYAYRGHVADANPATATVTFDLAPSQQVPYTTINVLMFGYLYVPAESAMRIYAEYDDGQELLWSGNVPTPLSTLDPETYPSQADLEVALTTTAYWGSAGSPPFVYLRAQDANVYQFKNGLPVDASRALKGLTFDFVPDAYNASGFAVMAVTGVPTPGGTMISIQ